MLHLLANALPGRRVAQRRIQRRERGGGRLAPLRQGLARRGQQGFRERLFRALVGRVKSTQALDLVTKQVDAHGPLSVWRPKVDNAAAVAESPRPLNDYCGFVAEQHAALKQLVGADHLPGRQTQNRTAEGQRRHAARHECPGRGADDQPVPRLGARGLLQRRQHGEHAGAGRDGQRIPRTRVIEDDIRRVKVDDAVRMRAPGAHLVSILPSGIRAAGNPEDGTWPVFLKRCHDRGAGSREDAERPGRGTLITLATTKRLAQEAIRAALPHQLQDTR